MSEHLILTQAWGGKRAGQKLRVLGPKEAAEGACVDADKAATLLRLGVAELYEKPGKKAKPAPEPEPEPEPEPTPVAPLEPSGEEPDPFPIWRRPTDEV